MAQSDFETAISDQESGSGATKELDQVTFYSQFDAALDVRIAAANTASPLYRKLLAIKQRVAERSNEVSASGAGLAIAGL